MLVPDTLNIKNGSFSGERVVDKYPLHLQYTYTAGDSVVGWTSSGVPLCLAKAHFDERFLPAV